MTIETETEPLLRAGRPSPSVPVWNGIVPSGLRELAGVVVALSGAPWWAARWALFPPEGAGPLRLYLFARMMYWYREVGATLPAPLTRWSDAAALPLRGIGTGNLFTTDGLRYRTIRIEPVPARGLAEGPDYVPVDPSPIPGYLVTPPGALGAELQPARPGEKVILYFHGGAYTQGHPFWTPLGLKTARDAKLRLLGVRYRLGSTSPSTAFPAQLQDALAGWRHLHVAMGFPSANILLVGESAGGHLALALTTALMESGDELPGGLALSSPWADMTLSFPSWESHTGDYLSRRALEIATAALTQHYTPAGVRSPLLSPALAPPGHWAPLAAAGVRALVAVGTAERFEDEIRALATTMHRDGVKITLLEDAGGLHCGPLIPFAPPNVYEEWSAAVNAVVAAM